MKGRLLIAQTRADLDRAARGVRARLRRLPPVTRALLWSASAGLVFVVLNTIARVLTIGLDPFVAQFWRYLCGLLVMLPFVWRAGLAAYAPRNVRGQFLRGGLHTLGLCLWFTALPHISLADTTAIGFTGPIFIMLGAALFLKERMYWDRWAAALIGFAGVAVVVAPRLSLSGGGYLLVMLASAPVFAASFLLAKNLSRVEKPSVIVLWQALTVTLLSAPLGLLYWQPISAAQFAMFMVAGLLGSLGHYCLTRAFHVADISATQSVKFLELIWAAVAGWLVWGDHTTSTTLLGGTVIAATTVWIARRESRRRIPS